MDREEVTTRDEAIRVALGWGGPARVSQQAAWDRGDSCPYTGFPSHKPKSRRRYVFVPNSVPDNEVEAWIKKNYPE